jgi:putative endonuclease
LNEIDRLLPYRIFGSILEFTARLPHALIMEWTVYIIRCDDNSLYTGVTTDLERRFREHLSQPRGAKYFNGRKPREVVYTENGHTRASACRRESAIKKLHRDEKLKLIRQDSA